MPFYAVDSLLYLSALRLFHLQTMPAAGHRMWVAALLLLAQALLAVTLAVRPARSDLGANDDDIDKTTVRTCMDLYLFKRQQVHMYESNLQAQSYNKSTVLQQICKEVSLASRVIAPNGTCT